jgi:solute carrier family 25 phosphate transporter 3
MTYRYRGLIWAGSAASAEMVADVGLCPFEMVKVKVQTSPAGTFPTKFTPALNRMWAQRAETRFPLGSLVPLWSRQIPYTVAKFVGFEYTVEQVYTHIFTQPKETYSAGTQLGITFGSGYVAGVFCAIISQPADNLVSQMSKESNRGKALGQIAREVGTK